MKSLPALFALMALAGGVACDLDMDEPVVSSTEAQAAITPVPDLDGLPGYYRRVPYLSAPLGELRSMWLTGDAHEGEYTRTVASLCFEPGCDVEAGSYWAVPNNPMIGFAFIGFFGEDGDPADYYTIDFITHDFLGRIDTLQMRKVNEESFGLPFLVKRFW